MKTTFFKLILGFLITITLYSCNLQRWDDVFVASCSWAGKASSCEAPCLVEFKNESEGLITEVHWDFGDGSPIYVTKDTLESPKHIYTKPQTYPASIKIFGVDDQGESRSAICTMDVVVGEWQCGDPLLDVRDSTYYGTIPMGNQCWMAENLNYGRFLHHNQENVPDPKLTPPQKFCLDNDPHNCDSLGGLYPWDALMDGPTLGTEHLIASNRGLCPSGWYVPTEIEWKGLIHAYGVDTSADCQPHRTNPMAQVCGGHKDSIALKMLATQLCNALHYTCEPCGCTDFNYLYSKSAYNKNHIGEPFETSNTAYFWTSSFADSNPRAAIFLGLPNLTITFSGQNRTDGNACRCVKSID